MVTSLPKRPARHPLRDVIHVVDDIVAAAELYRRMGFMVGPLFADEAFAAQTIHFPDGYLALMAGPEPTPEELGTVGEQGLEGIGFGDIEATADSHWRESPHLSGEIAPDSEFSEIGFGYAAPLGRVTDPALSRHANSASNIAGLVIVARNPSDHHILLSSLTGQRELRATSAGITAQTSGGEIGIVSPVAFRGLYGIEPPDVSRFARLAAARFNVRDRALLTAALAAADMPFITHMGHIVIGPATAMGATLVFEAAES